MSFHIDDKGVMRWAPWEQFQWLEHGFSTRAAGDFSDPNAVGAAAGLGYPASRLRTLKQVHSATVRTIEQADKAAPERLEGDALTGTQRSGLMGVRAADCLPILLLDPSSRAAAAVHAGWRGSAERIATHAVEQMVERFGSRLERLEAVLGPSIGPEAYEVGSEVAERFPDQAVRRRPDGARPHLDLPAANRLQLLEAGLSDEHIHVSGLCTFADPERFHSFRRDGERSGRMLAVIGIAAEYLAE